MSSNVTTYSDWVQLYEQSVVGDLAASAFAHSDATAATASASDGGSLTPRGNLSKPVRRRSRASKKTPTTILNTSASNFRALVQQFTGCQTRRSGPINLNFAGGSQQDGALPLNNETTVYGLDCYQSTERRRDEELLNYQEEYRGPNDSVSSAAGANYTENNFTAVGEEDFSTNLDEIRLAASGDRSDHNFFFVGDRKYIN